MISFDWNWEYSINPFGQITFYTDQTNKVYSLDVCTSFTCNFTLFYVSTEWLFALVALTRPKISLWNLKLLPSLEYRMQSSDLFWRMKPFDRYIWIEKSSLSIKAPIWNYKVKLLERVKVYLAQLLLITLLIPL